MGADINPEEAFSKTLLVAAKFPGVQVSREAYLRSALKRRCSEEQIRLAVEHGPAVAGIPADVIERAAKAAIQFETTRAAGLSAAAGVPGGLAILGTIPVDAAQYFAHMIRVSQKLAYLYGWPDLFSDAGDDLDDATKNVLILFLGVMLGANAANGAVAKVATMMAGQVAKKLPQQALTKGVIYPVVKRVATQLGVKMTKTLFANSVSKAVPLIGAVLSGSLTVATFLPMSYKLKRHLSDSDLARPLPAEPAGETIVVA